MMFLAAASLLTAVGVKNLNAQTTIDFEELTLSGANSHWDGSDESGGFTSGSAFFSNYYNTTWSSWSGFSYSNHTDNTTPGYGNQYSAYTGSGYNSSEKYAVFFSNGTIAFNQNLQSVQLAGVYITNTTYAALDMISGSAFSKQFGSPNGADGNPDGTNGEDWFLLTIYGLDENADTVGSVEFYLADFRFADNNDDYVVDTWEWVDLSTLGAVYSLAFGLTSSDVGAWGMNTPAYFAMDNLVIQGFTGLEQFTAQDVKLYPNPADNHVWISTTKTIDRLRVIDITGKEMINRIGENQQAMNFSVAELPSGVYLIQLVSGSETVTQKLIKK